MVKRCAWSKGAMLIMHGNCGNFYTGVPGHSGRRERSLMTDPGFEEPVSW